MSGPTETKPPCDCGIPDLLPEGFALTASGRYWVTVCDACGRSVLTPASEDRPWPLDDGACPVLYTKTR